MSLRERALEGAMASLAPALGGERVRETHAHRAAARSVPSNTPQEPLVFPAEPLGKRPRLGLVMIVKDEAEVILRCLDSVAHLIGWWTVVDTGSTDGTPEIIEQRLAHIPGTVYRREWRDFGWNRSEAVALARGSADYLLLLDADHVLVNEGFDPATLTHDSYTIQVRGGVAHEMPYLVQGDRPWYYRGRTHEYLTCDEAVTRASLSTLAVVHLGDGGTRHEKFVRDLVLLEADIRDNPDDPRTLFYLAQTRKDLGDHAGALAAYRRRIEVGGWAEEVFWSLYQCGAILAARGDWHYAQQALLAAWEYRPTRAEPLLVLAHGHRLRAQCHAALLMVERAAAIPLPTDLLFVETWVYEWGVDLELALNLVLAGQHERAVEVGGQLLAGERLPDQHRAPLEEHLRVAREALATVSPD